MIVAIQRTRGPDVTEIQRTVQLHEVVGIAGAEFAALLEVEAVAAGHGADEGHRRGFAAGQGITRGCRATRGRHGGGADHGRLQEVAPAGGVRGDCWHWPGLFVRVLLIHAYLLTCTLVSTR